MDWRPIAKIAGRSLGFDLLSVNSLMSPLFVAGFYYKTFMWPKKAWEFLYEPFIRRAAGLGRASGLPDPDAYEKSHAALRRPGDRRWPKRSFRRARSGTPPGAGHSGGQRLSLRWPIAKSPGGARVGIRVEPRRTPCARQCYAHAANNGVWSLRRRRVWCDRTRKRSYRYSTRVRTASAALEDHRQTRNSGNRSHRTADCIFRQRSARHHALWRGQHLPRPLRCRARSGGRDLRFERRLLEYGV